MNKSLVLLENVFVLDNWMTFCYELVVSLTIATMFLQVTELIYQPWSDFNSTDALTKL